MYSPTEYCKMLQTNNLPATQNNNLMLYKI